MQALLALLLIGSAAAGCIHDDRVDKLSHAELQERAQIQAFSLEAMWKMPNIAANAAPEKLEDCGSCQDAEVEVEMLQKTRKEQWKVQGIFALRATAAQLHDLSKKAENTKVESIADTKEEALSQDAKYPRVAELKQATRGPGAYFRKSALAYGKFMSHLEALKRIERTDKDGLFLVMKDPSVTLSEDWEQRLSSMLPKVPKDFDVLLLSSGKTNSRCEDSVPGVQPQNLYEVRRPMRTPDLKGQFYRGVEAYVVRKRSVPKILAEFKKVDAQPINVMLMSVHSENQDKGSDSKVYYSANGIYSYMHEDSELIVPLKK